MKLSPSPLDRFIKANGLVLSQIYPTQFTKITIKIVGMWLKYSFSWFLQKNDLSYFYNFYLNGTLISCVETEISDSSNDVFRTKRNFCTTFSAARKDSSDSSSISISNNCIQWNILSSSWHFINRLTSSQKKLFRNWQDFFGGCS